MNSKDNMLILGNSEQVANTVTAHYAREKTSDLVRQSFGGGQLCNGEKQMKYDTRLAKES